ATAAGDASAAAGDGNALEQALGVQLDPTAWLTDALAQLRALLGVDPDSLVFLPVLFAFIFLLRSAASFANGYFFQIIGLGATHDLRCALYDRILHQSSHFYAEHPSGELISRVGNDISVVQNAVTTRLLDLFQQSVTLIGLVYLLFATQPKLAAICLIIAPAVFYPIVRFGKGMRRTSHRSQERLADLSNLVAEAVRGHRVVKAFGMERFEARRFDAAARRHLRVRLKAQMLAYASGPVVETLAAIVAAVFLVYAGRTIRAGVLAPSELIAFLVNAIMLYDPIRKLNKVNLILQEALAATQRVQQVMAVPNRIVEQPDARAIDALREGIHFDRVAFAYEQAPVLRGIALTIARGEVVALVGSSGAGKSTLVNLLPRFFDPTDGAVRLDGADLRDLRLADLRSLIGVVTQDTVLFNDTVRNNIAYGREDLPFERVERAARAAYADDFVRQLPEGYDTVIGESGAKLSGGQRQRLAIARALVKDPPLLILDEATSHLDTESELLVQKALTNLMRDRTALVIAHRLSTVKQADRIVVMEAGQIVEIGTHQDLLDAPAGVYRRLHDLQFVDPADAVAADDEPSTAGRTA
ncbi:MAG: ABC transporter ATP-binding protein, partial [Acidobacteriota bacterium]